MLADKLKKMLSIKEAIRQAIIEKGVSCPDDTLLERYPDRIKKISTGAGGGMEPSLCFCRQEAILGDRQIECCDNGCKSNGLIRYYEGAGNYQLIGSYSGVQRVSIVVEE